MEFPTRGEGVRVIDESEDESGDLDVSCMLRDFLFVDPDRDDNFVTSLYCPDHPCTANKLDLIDLPSDMADITDQGVKISRGGRRVHYSCVGVKAELGQTLMSTGLTVWRAAENLARFIFTQPERFHNKRVIELGCGLGVVSIMLEKMQICSKIVATDGCPETIELLEKNIETSKCDVETIVAKEMSWGCSQEDEEDQNSFDVVLAADVIYEEKAIIPLLMSMEALLSKENRNAEILLAFARRNVPVDTFLVAASQRGFTWSIAERLPGTCAFVFDAEKEEWLTVDQHPESTEPIFCLKREIKI